jgi:hypothetical protein
MLRVGCTAGGALCKLLLRYPKKCKPDGLNFQGNLWLKKGSFANGGGGGIGGDDEQRGKFTLFLFNNN